MLFAIPFYVGSNTVADITLTFVTDNGLGSINANLSLTEALTKKDVLQGNYAINYKPTSHDDQAWRVMTTAGDSYATSTSKARVLVVR